MQKTELWNQFCRVYRVHEDSVRLFDTENDGVTVRTFAYGRDARPLLRRSAAMDRLVIAETRKVLQDYADRSGRYEGLIYLMYWQDAETVLPM